MPWRAPSTFDGHSHRAHYASTPLSSLLQLSSSLSSQPAAYPVHPTLGQRPRQENAFELGVRVLGLVISPIRDRFSLPTTDYYCM